MGYEERISTAYNLSYGLFLAALLSFVFVFTDVSESVFGYMTPVLWYLVAKILCLLAVGVLSAVLIFRDCPALRKALGYFQLWLIPLGPFTGYLMLKGDGADRSMSARLLLAGTGAYLVYTGIIYSILYIALAELTDLIEGLIGVLKLAVYAVGAYGFYSVASGVLSITSSARSGAFERLGKVTGLALLPVIPWGTLAGYLAIRMRG